MKKILSFIVLTLVLAFSDLSAEKNELGNFLGFSTDRFYIWGGLTCEISTHYYQFGTITFFNGTTFPPVVYYYGQDDLPPLAKESRENNVNNLLEIQNKEEQVYVYAYEANNIASPNPFQQKIIKGNESLSIKDLNLKLEKWKLYIIVFRNENGKIIDTKKIILTE